MMRLRRTAEVVERGDRIVQRLGAENDRERIACLLLVQVANENGESPVCDARVLSRYIDSKSERSAFVRNALTLCAQRRKLRMRALELRVDRVQIERRRVDALRKRVTRVT